MYISVCRALKILCECIIYERKGEERRRGRREKREKREERREKRKRERPSTPLGLELVGAQPRDADGPAPEPETVADGGKS